MTNHLPKNVLKHGRYYRGQCRNAEIARWNADKQVFVHWRTKFFDTFLEEIHCPEDEDRYDVFYAYDEIKQRDVKKEIPFEQT